METKSKKIKTDPKGEADLAKNNNIIRALNNISWSNEQYNEWRKTRKQLFRISAK